MEDHGAAQGPLSGVGILVTRPAHQAEPLCACIETQGGRAIRFPVLEILDPEDRAPLLEVIDRLDQFDLAIFISPNAVIKAMNLILGRRQWPSALRLAAIGSGSAKELARFGRAPDIQPARRFNSEALLALEEMQTVTGQRIVIFRGDGGREVLGDELRRRGAWVEYAEAYRRGRPAADVGRLMRHWARGEVDIITVTSNTGLRNLFELVGKLGQQWLRRTPLVVVSRRGVELARELGFRDPPIVADSADDAALLAALNAWARARGQD
ncbi:MAG: uroporphyrinogen III synthase [Chromatiales bacterium 21-64-14]|nr:MAG: uroporphyrinogen III synthase [Chromatiales bacterium 21-64-14]HQU14515.1 uroporphyrinogen-III synthase [Gammaproteobacteria bacterium]